jgi:anti-sigma B factor antagonist
LESHQPTAGRKLSRMPNEEFAVRVDEQDSGAVVSVAGEVDLGTAEELADALRGPTEAGKRVVLDLSACEFIDSSGLRALLGARSAAAAAGGSLALVVADANLMRVFEVASLDSLLEIHPTVDEALA